MQKFTSLLAAGFAAATLLLAAPAAQAQSPASTAAGELIASAATSPNGPDAPNEVVHTLRTPDEATAAAYYDDSHKDLKQVLAWMQETNALHPEYWSVYAEARIRLQLKDYAGALATATEAKKLALTAANPDYARRSEALMAQATAHRH